MTLPSLWSLLHAPFVELLGWTLLHFVWQGALAAAALAGALHILRDHPPRVRYAVSCVALAGLLALPLGTGVLLSGPTVPGTAAPSPSMEVAETTVALAPSPRAVATESAVGAVSSWRAWAASWVRPALPWVVLAWSLGVLAFAVRLGGGAWRVRRLRRSSTAVPSEWRERLRRLADRMDLNTSVELRQSGRVDGPVLSGWWRPVLLVPAGFLSGLPPTQVETLLMHELAHVRRHDVLVGRLQAAVETLLFFHPATWWISKQVRRTREACCDDLVVRAGADRRVYAQALTALAERAVHAPTTAWTPAAGDGSLLDRIRRLVAPSRTPSSTGRRLSIVAAALLMVLVPAGLAACASQQPSPGEPSSETKIPAEGKGAESPLAPPQDSEEGPAIVSVRDDSSQRVVTVIEREAVAFDSLDTGGFVVRHGGERVDTLRGPDLENVKRTRGAFFSPDTLDRHLRGLRLHSDSLERIILGDINPDSLMRLIQSRFHADSLKRVLRKRFDLDSLGHRALQVRWDADRFARSLGEQLPDDEFDDWPADSTFDVAPFDREDVGPDLDVDSLIRRHEHRADSLHRRFERMRERIEENRSEHLREQARRLRERAERLEERAEEMNERPSTDSSGTAFGGLDAPAPGPRFRFVVDDFRRQGEGRSTQTGGAD